MLKSSGVTWLSNCSSLMLLLWPYWSYCDASAREAVPLSIWTFSIVAGFSGAFGKKLLLQTLKKVLSIPCFRFIWQCKTDLRNCWEHPNFGHWIMESSWLIQLECTLSVLRFFVHFLFLSIILSKIANRFMIFKKKSLNDDNQEVTVVISRIFFFIAPQKCQKIFHESLAP